MKKEKSYSQNLQKHSDLRNIIGFVLVTIFFALLAVFLLTQLATYCSHKSNPTIDELLQSMGAEEIQEAPLEGTMPVFDNVADWNITDEAPVDNVERVTYFSVNLQINPEPYISLQDYLEEYCQNATVSCDFLCWTIGNHPERCISMAEAIKMLEEDPVL